MSSAFFPDTYPFFPQVVPVDRTNPVTHTKTTSTNKCLSTSAKILMKRRKINGSRPILRAVKRPRKASPEKLRKAPRIGRAGEGERARKAATPTIRMTLMTTILTMNTRIYAPTIIITVTTTPATSMITITTTTTTDINAIATTNESVAMATTEFDAGKKRIGRRWKRC